MERRNWELALSSLACLGLLTFADSVTNNLPPTLANDSQMQPGSWNLRTRTIVLGRVSDMIGQFVLGYVLETRSKCFAMFINTTSILAAVILTSSSVLLCQDWSLMAATAGQLIKCGGGGSHGTGYLTLAILHSQTPQHRFLYYYLTGAITLLSQTLGSFAASTLSKHSHILPGALSAFCCIMTYAIILFLRQSDTHTKDPNQDESSPLLADGQQISRNDNAPASYAPLSEYPNSLYGSSSRSRGPELRHLPIVFFLMGFCKSTRPLFTTYIQDRHGVSPAEADHLWLVRTVLSVALFVFIGLHTAYTKQSEKVNLALAKISILFISSGALAIGLSWSYYTITIALIVNTVGVVTDLNILTFVSTQLKHDDASPEWMFISSTESFARNFAEIDGLLAGFAHLDATEPPPALSQVHHQNDLASALDALCNASPVNNPEVQGLEKCWSSIRTARDGMQILWEHFVNVSKDLNLPVVHDIRKSYRDGKGLRREGIFAFRNGLAGQAPHGLGQIFAFCCLSYVTSCLLHCRNRLDKGDILAGINLSFYFSQKEDERRAFIRLAERLWPEALGHLHFTVLALNDNSRQLSTALRLSGVWPAGSHVPFRRNKPFQFIPDPRV
ncbi:uncharacterized protein FFNC_15412 [Fusarium fujikuroi]|nr:uncharacterized protein FFNC_15412 [Fusarium fujikuroi]